MSRLTASDLASRADLVQLFNGSIWAIAKGECLKLDFWADSAGQKAPLETLLPLVVAWRENGWGGSTFGRWHNLADDKEAAA